MSNQQNTELLEKLYEEELEWIMNNKPTDHQMMSSFGTKWHDGL